jgi:hypothetical protein
MLIVRAKHRAQPWIGLEPSRDLTQRPGADDHVAVDEHEYIPQREGSALVSGGSRPTRAGDGQQSGAVRLHDVRGIVRSPVGHDDYFAKRRAFW